MYRRLLRYLSIGAYVLTLPVCEMILSLLLVTFVEQRKVKKMTLVQTSTSFLRALGPPPYAIVAV